MLMQAVELHGGYSLFFRDAGFCCCWPQGLYTAVAAWFAGVPFLVLAAGCCTVIVACFEGMPFLLLLAVRLR